MTFSDFKNLNISQRCDAIWEWGFYVSKVKTEEFSKILYALNGYFAEMVIRTSDNEIVEVQPISNIDGHLNTYSIEKGNPFLKVSNLG